MHAHTSLRQRIRADTRFAHDVLDACAGRLDLQQYGDFRAFVSAHEQVYRHLSRHGQAAGEHVADRLARATSDLKALGGQPGQPSGSATLPGIHPLGVSYVIVGAHFGARILVRQWRISRDRQVRAAHRLLTDPTQADCWSLICSRLQALPATGVLADRIVATANYCFDVFRTAFASVMPDGERSYDVQSVRFE